MNRTINLVAAPCGPHVCDSGKKCEAIDSHFHLCACPLFFAGPTCNQSVAYDVPRIDYRSLTILKQDNLTSNPFDHVVLKCTADSDSRYVVS
ncbi:hypothetical protein V1264_024698 [Littorina saxatilis]|uniref:EGF-like domain-containing protein n=1 Tax=Littorina saxatilis TaxID=31220 RepID=A0AAN9AMD7_9CAEN